MVYALPRKSRGLLEQDQSDRMNQRAQGLQSVLDASTLSQSRFEHTPAVSSSTPRHTRPAAFDQAPITPRRLLRPYHDYPAPNWSASRRSTSATPSQAPARGSSAAPPPAMPVLEDDEGPTASFARDFVEAPSAQRAPFIPHRRVHEQAVQPARPLPSSSPARSDFELSHLAQRPASPASSTDDPLLLHDPTLTNMSMRAAQGDASLLEMVRRFEREDMGEARAPVVSATPKRPLSSRRDAPTPRATPKRTPKVISKATPKATPSLYDRSLGVKERIALIRSPEKRISVEDGGDLPDMKWEQDALEPVKEQEPLAQDDDKQGHRVELEREQELQTETRHQSPSFTEDQQIPISSSARFEADTSHAHPRHSRSSAPVFIDFFAENVELDDQLSFTREPSGRTSHAQHDTSWFERSSETSQAAKSYTPSPHASRSQRRTPVAEWRASPSVAASARKQQRKQSVTPSRQETPSVSQMRWDVVGNGHDAKEKHEQAHEGSEAVTNVHSQELEIPGALEGAEADALNQSIPRLEDSGHVDVHEETFAELEKLENEAKSVLAEMPVSPAPELGSDSYVDGEGISSTSAYRPDVSPTEEGVWDAEDLRGDELDEALEAADVLERSHVSTESPRLPSRAHTPPSAVTPPTPKDVSVQAARIRRSLSPTKSPNKAAARSPIKPEHMQATVTENMPQTSLLTKFSTERMQKTVERELFLDEQLLNSPSKSSARRTFQEAERLPGSPVKLPAKQTRQEPTKETAPEPVAEVSSQAVAPNVSTPCTPVSEPQAESFARSPTQALGKSATKSSSKAPVYSTRTVLDTSTQDDALDTQAESTSSPSTMVVWSLPLQAPAAAVTEDTSIGDLSASLSASSHSRAVMLSRARPTSCVEISSLDPMAAARAAAILKVHHRYIQEGWLGKVEEPKSYALPMEASEHSAVDLATVFDAAEHAVRHPIDAGDSSSTARTPRVPGAFTPRATYPAPQLDSHALRPQAQAGHWSEHAWKELDWHFRACIPEGSDAAETVLAIDADQVILQFLESQGLEPDDLRGDWTLTRLYARVPALQARYLRELEHDATAALEEKSFQLLSESRHRKRAREDCVDSRTLPYVHSTPMHVHCVTVDAAPESSMVSQPNNTLTTDDTMDLMIEAGRAPKRVRTSAKPATPGVVSRLWSWVAGGSSSRTSPHVQTTSMSPPRQARPASRIPRPRSGTRARTGPAAGVGLRREHAHDAGLRMYPSPPSKLHTAAAHRDPANNQRVNPIPTTTTASDTERDAPMSYSQP